MSEYLYCSFCGNNDKEVSAMIAARNHCICDNCIILCLDILKNEKTTVYDKIINAAPK